MEELNYGPHFVLAFFPDKAKTFIQIVKGFFPVQCDAYSGKQQQLGGLLLTGSNFDSDTS